MAVSWKAALAWWFGVTVDGPRRRRRRRPAGCGRGEQGKVPLPALPWCGAGRRNKKGSQVVSWCGVDERFCRSRKEREWLSLLLVPLLPTLAHTVAKGREKIRKQRSKKEGEEKSINSFARPRTGKKAGSCSEALAHLLFLFACIGRCFYFISIKCFKSIISDSATIATSTGDINV